MLDVTGYWYRPRLHLLTLLLIPFSWLFYICISIRRFFYQVGILKSHTFKAPVIIVGNITAGGTGKTPLVIWLADFLRSNGYVPGIVSRGYGGERHVKPYWVSPHTTPREAGDEAILLARRTNCPIVIGVNRVADVNELLRHSNCNVVIADDGLQHYRLGRAVEIAVIDGLRRFGNRHLLPAGPLREPAQRIKDVDLVIVNEGNHDDEHTMTLVPCEFVSLKNKHTCTINHFSQKKVHAIASIGHPERFFNTLRNAGMIVIPHVFPDHFRLRSDDIYFDDDLPVIMTEKDAVKCEAFADERHWYVTVTAHVDEGFKQKLLLQLQSMEVGQ